MCTGPLGKESIYLSSRGQKTKYSSLTSSLTFCSRLVSWFIITHLLKS